MIENATNNSMNLSFGNTDIGCNSDKNKSFNNPLKNDSPYLKAYDNPSCISKSGSSVGFKEVLHAMELLMSIKQEPDYLFDQIVKVYTEILKADCACIFESYTNGDLRLLACYPKKSSDECSTQTRQDLKYYNDHLNFPVLSSLPYMTKAIEKDQSIKVWQISSREESPKYAVSLPLIYDSSSILAIILLSSDAQFFTAEQIQILQIVANYVSPFLIDIRPEKSIGQEQFSQINDHYASQEAQNKATSIKLTSDITQEACRELEALSYSISHDLRAPLRAIHSNCEWLEKQYAIKLDEEGSGILKQVITSSENMERLLDGLLEFSKAVQSEPNRSLIDMTYLVHSVTDELIKTECDLPSLSIHIKPLIPAYGDETLIRQVWINLASNAFKFTRNKNKREVEIGSYRSNGDIAYYINDNGAGFDMQYANRLFTAFHRLHGVDEFEGTGVGLAIVNRIIKRHGGRVWAEGKIDNGARFYFTLPKR